MQGERYSNFLLPPPSAFPFVQDPVSSRAREIKQESALGKKGEGVEGGEVSVPLDLPARSDDLGLGATKVDDRDEDSESDEELVVGDERQDAGQGVEDALDRGFRDVERSSEDAWKEVTRSAFEIGCSS